ncbi:hypothetical protein ACO0QE_001740 [Hanseniaspora vineae]
MSNVLFFETPNCVVPIIRKICQRCLCDLSKPRIRKRLTASEQQLLKNEDKSSVSSHSQLYVRHTSKPISPKNLTLMENFNKAPSLSVFQQNDRELMRAYRASEFNVAPDTAQLRKIESVSNDFVSNPAFFTGQRCDFSSHTYAGNSILSPSPKGEQLDIKGLVDVSGFNFLRKRFMNSDFLFYKCAYFHMYYFPPQHYLNLFCKSEVGMQVAIRGATFVNGNKVGTIYEDINNIGNSLEGQPDKDSHSAKNLEKQSCGKSSGSSKKDDMRAVNSKHKIDVQNVINPKTIHYLDLAKGCSIPSQQAFQRTNTRKFFRNTFRKQWLATQERLETRDGNPVKEANIGFSKKGFYLYSVLLVPDRLRFGDEQYAQHISKSVLKVNSLDWNKDLQPKVRIANNAVPVSFLNERLSKAGIDYRVFKRKTSDDHVI